MPLPPAAAVAAGGVIGAGLRWGIVAVLPSTEIPWPVVAVNALGCFVLGCLLGGRGAPRRMQLLVGVGFCGGLTTMSTFAVDIAELLRDERVGPAVIYLAGSLVLGATALLAGHRIRRHEDPR